MQKINPQLMYNDRTFHRHVWFHIILWTLAFIILVFVFTKGNFPQVIDIYYTLVFLSLAAIPVNINFYVLMKYLLKSEKYFLYLVSFVLICLGFGSILKVFFLDVIDALFPDYYFISYISGNDYYLVLSIILLSSTLLKLAKDWLLYNKTQNEILRFQKQHVQSQLLTLKSQINPHFLFNALNVIYAMAIDDKAKIQDAVLELSDILRYVIYDTQTDQILLQEEITLLNNYIAFQKYRVNTKVHFSIEIQNEKFKIYPMLLLPLLENAYKYGSTASNDKAKIDIEILQHSHSLKFILKNEKLNLTNLKDDGYSGLGLQTVKQNLDLVYGENHKFEIKEDDSFFEINLSIENHVR